MSVDNLFGQVSLISAAFISSERFWAIYWPFKHKTLSIRAHGIAIFLVWTPALLIAAVWTALDRLISTKHGVYAWSPIVVILLLIVCGLQHRHLEKVSTWKRRFTAANQSVKKQTLNKDLAV